MLTCIFVTLCVTSLFLQNAFLHSHIISVACYVDTDTCDISNGALVNLPSVGRIVTVFNVISVLFTALLFA